MFFPNRNAIDVSLSLDRAFSYKIKTGAYLVPIWCFIQAIVQRLKPAKKGRSQTLNENRIL